MPDARPEWRTFWVALTLTRRDARVASDTNTRQVHLGRQAPHLTQVGPAPNRSTARTPERGVPSRNLKRPYAVLEGRQVPLELVHRAPRTEALLEDP